MKLTVLHDDFPAASKAAEMVSNGWPQVLSKLKTLLETGETFRIERPARRDEGDPADPSWIRRHDEYEAS